MRLCVMFSLIVCILSTVPISQPITHSRNNSTSQKDKKVKLYFEICSAGSNAETTIRKNEEKLNLFPKYKVLNYSLELEDSKYVFMEIIQVIASYMKQASKMIDVALKNKIKLYSFEPIADSLFGSTSNLELYKKLFVLGLNDNYNKISYMMSRVNHKIDSISSIKLDELSDKADKVLSLEIDYKSKPFLK